MRGVAKGLGIIVGEPPQQAIQTGIPTPAISADTWEVGVVPGCSHEEEEGWGTFPGSELPWRASESL